MKKIIFLFSLLFAVTFLNRVEATPVDVDVGGLQNEQQNLSTEQFTDFMDFQGLLLATEDCEIPEQVTTYTTAPAVGRDRSTLVSFVFPLNPEVVIFGNRITSNIQVNNTYRNCGSNFHVDLKLGKYRY